MAEKFAANPVTGTGTLSVPIATSRGRNGFGPELTLTYDSGAGNGPFGFGWSISLPSISRKTDKGLPQYLDSLNSDVFILSGAEDLVPVYRQDLDGSWLHDHPTYRRDPDGFWIRDLADNLVVHEDLVDGYWVRRYRPRIEALFARIERWTRISAPNDVHWRSLSKDNVLTVYGADASSRIADPEKSGRIFSWLICETRDGYGNAITYDYKPEDGIGVDLSRPNERNRGPANEVRRTANRYLKRIRYGNRKPLLDDAGQRPRSVSGTNLTNAGWMFEVVLDYGEHHSTALGPTDSGDWLFRGDSFSSYRSGFEVRTTRLCQRVLMFHHFPEEPGVGTDCLVRSTDFFYIDEENPTTAPNPLYTLLMAVSQTGYRRNNDGYEQRSLPPIEFEYTRPEVYDTVEEFDPVSLENLPIGVDGIAYQWTDLHGEGIPGILTEQAGVWYYKRNLSPAARQSVEFAPLERVTSKPSLASLTREGGQFMDLAGNGQPDVVVLDGPMVGFYEHDEGEGWQPFKPFSAWPNHDLGDPNLKFVDLNGDGHADVFITEDEVFVWHASLAEEGFGPARRVVQALDEEKGPRVVFADGSQSIHLADMSGDGLTDLVRIRNGEACYWPNLGYGRFGAKVTMDHAPWFDNPDQFDQKRIRLADIDGSGTIDIIYLHRDGVCLYFNQSGNGWSEAQTLPIFPPVDDLVDIVPADLLGNGTACLVWSSPLPGDARRPMRYVRLMGGQKPHLLVKIVNNLGAETRLKYAPSTKFYLQDKRAGKPWLTKLPFPVHVVEQVETSDHISRNRFLSRYAYHHGYFDGEEREFRGFGMVEQWDTEELAALTADGTLTTSTNIDLASHVPPVHTKTWFHTGAYLGRDHISDFFAGLKNGAERGEYYREPGLTDEEAINLGLDEEARRLHDDARARVLLLPDTVLPSGMSLAEEREACRALKGLLLRQEVYADDAGPEATAAQLQRARTPYSITEQNFCVRRDQPRGGNRHAVFYAHPREAMTCHYERNPADPRIQHALTLEVDPFGNVLRQAAIGYGRCTADASLPTDEDRAKQTRMLITYGENRVTNGIDDGGNYRTPLPSETRIYELTGFKPEHNAARFSLAEWTRNSFALPTSAVEIPYEQTADQDLEQKRLIELVRVHYRRDNLTALLPFGQLQALALPGETYKLAFTAGLLAQVFQRDTTPLLPAPAIVLGGQGADQGGYVDLDDDGQWWLPTGRLFLSPNTSDTAEQELAHARRHFFLPHRSRDPFNAESFVTYDAYDLLMVETRDALGNRLTVGERRADGALDLDAAGNDYRVLQPWRVMDPNRNRIRVAFDALGMVVGTAVMGKPEENMGDSLDGFVADLTETATLDHLADPLADPHALLGQASTRLVYDLFAYQRTKDTADPQPVAVYTLARETHHADLAPAQQTRLQHSLSFSDGFGRDIQKKIQAEAEKTSGVAGPPRWVGSGWTIFNNKGKPVRQYEPFFSTTHRFEFGVQIGVSSIVFYDPVERVITTLHPNNTYEKVVFNPWRQVTFDVNDTVLGNPRTDADIGGYTAAYFAGLPASPVAPSWQTWYEQRRDGALGAREQSAAAKAAAHAETQTTVHFDALGRPFLTVTHNKTVCPNHDLDGTDVEFCTRVVLDIEGNLRAVIDANDRLVMRYDYDLLGNCIRQASMEAGNRWMLNDVTGKPIRVWDSRGHTFRTAYDPLRRRLRSFVTGTDPTTPDQEILAERLVYGEQHPEAELRNLRDKLYLHCDQAGTASTEEYDFKGNPLLTWRRIAWEYKQTIDWRTLDLALPAYPADPVELAALEAAIAPLLEGAPYTSRSTYDALNRPATITTPHTPTMRPSLICPSYNEANLLERVDANLGRTTTNGQLVWTPFVTNIDYDAKGRRQRIDYGNGASTFYDYDPLTFRLVGLRTRRNVLAFPDDCPDPAPTGWPGCQVQNLHYTYDPAGNITHIRDDAQQTIYFRNRRVEPSAKYTYDAFYRLIEAQGREHLGQTNGITNPPTSADASNAYHARRDHPGDGQAMGSYIERYVYDAVGNFLAMQHRGSDPVHPGWARSYDYSETSLLEPAKPSNRLSSTTTGNENPTTARYLHDIHGNMTRMPHLGGEFPDPNLHWDYRDQLGRADLGGGGTAYYVYDAAGQRVRKVWEKSATLVEERIYLGGFEIYRRRQGGELLERETLHIIDDRQRVALVETRTLDTAGDDPAPAQVIRYQFGNHLGSSSLELDGQGQTISYEEYTPYGSTSYQAVRSQVETAKRYRYTGKERDEETGFSYFGYRYLSSWLGSWTQADRFGPIDTLNLYRYAKSNPIKFFDQNGSESATEDPEDPEDPESSSPSDQPLPTPPSLPPPSPPAPPAPVRVAMYTTGDSRTLTETSQMTYNQLYESAAQSLASPGYARGFDSPQELLEYLQSLPDDSVASFDFVGHGAPSLQADPTAPDSQGQEGGWFITGTPDPAVEFTGPVLSAEGSVNNEILQQIERVSTSETEVRFRACYVGGTRLMGAVQQMLQDAGHTGVVRGTSWEHGVEHNSNGQITGYHRAHAMPGATGQAEEEVIHSTSPGDLNYLESVVPVGSLSNDDPLPDLESHQFSP